MSDRDGSPTPSTLAVPPGVVVPAQHRSLRAAGITFGPYGSSQEHATTMTEAELEQADLYDFVDAYRVARKEKVPLRWARDRECSTCQYHKVTCVFKENKKFTGMAQLPCNHCRSSKTQCTLTLEYTALLLAEYMGFPVEWSEARMRNNWQAVKRTGSVSYEEIQARIRARVSKAKNDEATESGHDLGLQEQATGSGQDAQTRGPTPIVEQGPSPPLTADAGFRPSTPIVERAPSPLTADAVFHSPAPVVEQAASPPLTADAGFRPSTPIVERAPSPLTADAGFRPSTPIVEQAPSLILNTDTVSRTTTPVAEPSMFSQPPPSPANLALDASIVSPASANPELPAHLSTLERDHKSLHEKYQWALKKIRKLERQTSAGKELDGRLYGRRSTRVKQEIRRLQGEVDLQASYIRRILEENEALRRDRQAWKNYARTSEDEATDALEDARAVEEQVDERVRIERASAVNEVRAAAEKEIEKYKALYEKLGQPIHTIHWLKVAVEQIQLGDELEMLMYRHAHLIVDVRERLLAQLESIGPVTGIRKQDVGAHLMMLLQTTQRQVDRLYIAGDWKAQFEATRLDRWTNKYKDPFIVTSGLRSASSILQHFRHSTEEGDDFWQHYWGEHKAVQADEPPPDPRTPMVWGAGDVHDRPIKRRRLTIDDGSGDYDDLRSVGSSEASGSGGDEHGRSEDHGSVDGDTQMDERERSESLDNVDRSADGSEDVNSDDSETDSSEDEVIVVNPDASETDSSEDEAIVADGLLDLS